MKEYYLKWNQGSARVECSPELAPVLAQAILDHHDLEYVEIISGLSEQVLEVITKKDNDPPSTL